MDFSKISETLANGLTEELDFSDDQKEIISYAIETTLLSIIGTVMVTCLAYFFDALVPAIIAAVFGGLLRKLSGGAHLNTPLKCLIFGALTYSSIGVLAKNLQIYKLINQNILLLILLVCFLIVLLLAPVDSHAKPIHSEKLKIKLKISSMGFVLISFILISVTNDLLINVSAALGLLYQSITLLPIFNKRR
ncbi:MAG: accessory gene regulator ArgB-like protein [Chloroflexota bacterium]